MVYTNMKHQSKRHAIFQQILELDVAPYSGEIIKSGGSTTEVRYQYAQPAGQRALIFGASVMTWLAVIIVSSIFLFLVGVVIVAFTRI
jgi:hypothetical protein